MKKSADNQKSDRNPNDWLECRSNESNDSDFEYKYEEDADAMAIKKFKRKRLEEEGEGISILREPLLYRETVSFNTKDVDETCAIVREMIDEEYCLPLGFPTEQFIIQLKNLAFHKQ